MREGRGSETARGMALRSRQGDIMVKLKLIRSWIGCSPRQRKVLAALGLRRIHMVKEYKDTPALRGMVAKIPHMLEVVS